jgi:hypothetical protein
MPLAPVSFLIPPSALAVRDEYVYHEDVRDIDISDCGAEARHLTLL